MHTFSRNVFSGPVPGGGRCKVLCIRLLSPHSTIPSLHWTPNVGNDFLTASFAYSACKIRPRGLKIVVPVSYPLLNWSSNARTLLTVPRRKKEQPQINSTGTILSWSLTPLGDDGAPEFTMTKRPLRYNIWRPRTSLPPAMLVNCTRASCHEPHQGPTHKQIQ